MPALAIGLANETLAVLRFHKPIGVLRVIPKGLRRFMLVGNSSKRSDPLGDSPRICQNRILNLRV